MTRVTLVAFALLTGFFYVTGKPVDETGQVTSTFADYSKHKMAAERSSTGASLKQLISPKISSSQNADRNRKSTDVRSRQLARTKSPALPARNPRRSTTSSPKYALTASPSPVKAAVKPIRVANTDTNKTFREGRNQFTGGFAKPLGLSYRQRFVKSQKPVLGPRLTAVLLKRELRRVGCYSGNVTSRWDESARAAITFYNTSTGANLATKSPLVSSLEAVQKTTKTVCVEQPVIEGTIIASAGKIQGLIASKIQGQSKATDTVKAKKKTTKWRTSVQYKKAAYRPTTTSSTPQYEIKRPLLIERYIAPPAPRAKPRRAKRRIIRKRRAKRSRKYRVAKRKARRRTAVRSWRKRHRRKRFGFSRSGGSVSLND